MAIGIDLVDEVIDRLPVAEVTPVSPEAPSTRHHRTFNLAARGFHVGARADDIRSRFRQCDRHRLAEAAPRAGDQRGLAIQSK